MGIALCCAACGPKVQRGVVPVARAAAPVRVIVHASPVVEDVWFIASLPLGAAWDPVGREGLAALTARSLVAAGAGDRDGAAVRALVDAAGGALEVTVGLERSRVALRCPRAAAASCAGLLVDLVTAPRFEPSAVGAVRDAAVATLDGGLQADPGALADVALDAWIFAAHPYGHPVDGRSGVLPLLDAEDARAFYARQLVRERVVVGLGGGVDDAVEATVRGGLERLPGRLPPELPLQRPLKASGQTVLVVDLPGDVAAVRAGHPLDLAREHADWPAVLLGLAVGGEGAGDAAVRSLCGETPPGIGTSLDDAGGRRQAVVRHGVDGVAPEALGGAWEEALAAFTARVAAEPSADALEAARGRLMAAVQGALADPALRLACAVDAAAGGAPDPLERLPDAWGGLTPADVAEALRAHLRPEEVRVVVVGPAQSLPALPGGPAPRVVPAAGLFR